MRVLPTVVIEMTVWEMQSTTVAIVAYADWVYETTLELGNAVLAWAVEFSGQVVTKFQRSVSDGKTAHDRKKQKKQPQSAGSVRRTGDVHADGEEKPKDKGEVRNRVGIMFGLAGRSDEVVVGTTERVVKARHMPIGQRGGATCAKSIRGVPWQPNPAEEAEGKPSGIALARTVSVQMVAVEHRPAVPVMEPRDHKARRFYIRREVELAKYGFSDDCEDAVWRRVGAGSETAWRRMPRAHQTSCDEPASRTTRVEAEQRGR